MVNFGVHHLPLPGAAPAAKKWGSLPPLPPPPVRRHDAACEGVDTRCRRPTGLYPIGLGQSVPARVQCRFPGTTWTTTARAAPSESGALGLLRGRATTRATSVRHPLFLSGASIPRHVLDPRRRKSSIMSRPLEAGFFCSHWSIFSMTTSRLAWRSTVSSCTLNPRALPGRLDFLTPWHSRAPGNASWTDFPLRDHRSRRLWGNRNCGPDSELLDRGALGRGRNSVRSNRPGVTVRSSRDCLDPHEVGGACDHRRSVGSAHCASPGRRMDSTA